MLFFILNGLAGVAAQNYTSNLLNGIGGSNSLGGQYRHVVILSIDGLHATDLSTYIAMKPSSALADLSNSGITFENAECSKPSDSLPGTAALLTGAKPRTHGIWYDDTWDKSLYSYKSNCTGKSGFNVQLTELLDANDTVLNGGNAFNVTMLPYKKTDWGACVPLLPHDYIRSKTIFEVVRDHGGSTKMTDKHPAYEIFNGPSGTGIYEQYFPEINAIKGTVSATEAYDLLHWDALGNWTAGMYQNGTVDPRGVPALFTSNFQSVSVAQKTGGYLNGSTSSAPLFSSNLTQALEFTDRQLGSFVQKMKDAGIYNSTLLIVTAKHGQSPMDPKLLRKIPSSNLTAATNVSIAQLTTDDVALVFLSIPTRANIMQAKSDFLAKASSLGIQTVLAGFELYQNGYGSNYLDSRVPDLLIQVQPGVIYTTSATKTAEHGGINPDDINVAMLVSNPNLSKKSVQTMPVYTRQVAVTALKALGAPVSQLDGAQEDGTLVLPGLDL